MHPLEAALIRTVRWLIPALLLSPLLLAVPEPDDPFVLFILHLSAIVSFGIALAVTLAPLAGEGCFTTTRWSPAKRRLAGAAALVALDTGAVALVTLASSAALRFDASLQFLQLLSSLDIAWAGAAIAIGAYLMRGTRQAAWTGGVLLGIFCVFSIWRYLDIVGFAPNGGWKVSGADLMRYVIPFDMAAAVVAVLVLWRGAHAGLRTEQASVQS